MFWSWFAKIVAAVPLVLMPSVVMVGHASEWDRYETFGYSFWGRADRLLLYQTDMLLYRTETTVLNSATASVYPGNKYRTVRGYYQSYYGVNQTEIPVSFRKPRSKWNDSGYETPRRLVNSVNRGYLERLRRVQQLNSHGRTHSPGLSPANPWRSNPLQRHSYQHGFYPKR